jgi:hypothetical protein
LIFLTQEIGDALTGSLNDVDDSDLLAELQAMEQVTTFCFVFCFGVGLTKTRGLTSSSLRGDHRRMKWI